MSPDNHALRTMAQKRFAFLLTFLPVAVGVWLATVWVGCHETSTPPRRPHVVLISLDTMRQDHLGTYNANSAWLTPELDRFAEEATVFERAYAPIPFTLASHLSMLTGVYPDVHGVDSKDEKLNPRLQTLPERLEQAGFHNLGLVSNNWMDPEFGFERGFALYERVDYDLTYSDRINRHLTQWLDERTLEQEASPLFLFLHYTDAHSDFYNVKRNLLPYYAPEEQLKELGLTGDPERFCDEEGNCASAFLVNSNPGADRPSRPLSSEQINEIARLYQAGVLYLDRDLGQLFSLLRERQLWDDALIIVTADHGEEFREHGQFLHGQIYAETLLVPLMIKFPEGQWAGQRLDDIVEIVDLPPTILDWLDITPDAPVQGRSLLPLIQRSRRAKDLAFGRQHLQSQFSLRTPEWTLIHDFASGDSELYDAKQDSAESQNLSAEHPEAVEELLVILRRIVNANERLAKNYSGESGEVILTPEEQKQLRALGYLP